MTDNDIQQERDYQDMVYSETPNFEPDVREDYDY
jgi:hypothetical protein